MVNPFKKNKVESSKTYNHQKDGVTLNFTLTTKRQKQIFIELLKVAILELEEEIK